MHFFASVILSTTFCHAHTVKKTTHPLSEKNCNIKNLQPILRLNTTSNFSRDSKILLLYPGGLNYRLSIISSRKYVTFAIPNTAGMVKETVEEFGIKYLGNETFKESLNSHIHTLKRFTDLHGFK